MIDEFIFKGVTIRKDQDERIKKEKEKGFKINLSRFLQFKLDEYFKFRDECDALATSDEVEKIRENKK